MKNLLLPLSLINGKNLTLWNPRIKSSYDCCLGCVCFKIFFSLVFYVAVYAFMFPAFFLCTEGSVQLIHYWTILPFTFPSLYIDLEKILNSCSLSDMSCVYMLNVWMRRRSNKNEYMYTFHAGISFFSSALLRKWRRKRKSSIKVFVHVWAICWISYRQLKIRKGLDFSAYKSEILFLYLRLSQ